MPNLRAVRAGDLPAHLAAESGRRPSRSAAAPPPRPAPSAARPAPPKAAARRVLAGDFTVEDFRRLREKYPGRTMEILDWWTDGVPRNEIEKALEDGTAPEGEVGPYAAAGAKAGSRTLSPEDAAAWAKLFADWPDSAGPIAEMMKTLTPAEARAELEKSPEAKAEKRLGDAVRAGRLSGVGSFNSKPRR